MQVWACDGLSSLAAWCCKAVMECQGSMHHTSTCLGQVVLADFVKLWGVNKEAFGYAGCHQGLNLCIVAEHARTCNKSAYAWLHRQMACSNFPFTWQAMIAHLLHNFILAIN